MEVSAEVRIMTTEEVYEQYNREGPVEKPVPDPWKGSEPSTPPVEEVEEEVSNRSWENWDNG